MKKLSLVVCMSLFMCSLTGCDIVGFLTQKVGKGVNEEKTEEKEDKKEEKKEETKTEEDTTVYDLSVMDLLDNADTYNGKKVRVLGVIPEGNITSSDGTEVFGVLSEDGNYYIEITGTMPDNRYCKSYVTGTANMIDGEIVIDATGYEVVEQYEQATEEQASQQVVEQPVVDQSQVVQQPQIYNYRIVDGQYIFDTVEGQYYWDSTHPATDNSSTDSTTSGDTSTNGGSTDGNSTTTE